MDKREERLKKYEEIEQFNIKQIESIDSDSIIHTEQQIKDLGIDPYVDLGDDNKGGRK